jgi:hypothetical protein
MQRSWTVSNLYDNRFFDWVDYTASRSARRMLPIAQRIAKPASVVDVGCGRGTWLAEWVRLGITDIKGLDGDYVDRSRLAIAANCFEATDLRSPRAIGRRFDLAQSLEVAEHLPPGAGPAFVGMLCDLSDIVMFSAAQPGQGGEDHINERLPSYWAGLFAARGYAAFDCIRPLVREAGDLDPWYRYNTIVLANAAGQARLSAEAIAARVDELERLDGGGSMLWRLRRIVLRPLPVGAVTRLSRLHYALVCALARRPSDAQA